MEHLFAFQFRYCQLCVKDWWGGGRKHCEFLFFGGALIVGWWGVFEWGRKTYLWLAKTASFSSQHFSRSNKHDTFQHVVSTGYFYALFLWAIAFSDFRPLEIYKNVGLPLSFITFTVNSHADFRPCANFFLLRGQYFSNIFLHLEKDPDY